MCGIAGICSIDGRALEERHEAAVRRMTATLAHRGPDDAGLYLSPDRTVVLGHRRLSIIDPTPEAHQPMIIAGNALTYNGEVYNFEELRKQYHLDTPHSDTAILLELLNLKGKAALAELRGFFAFAYYRPSEGSLLLARDALGKKPIYYRESHGLLLFASEERALLASGLVPFEIDRHALSLYFRYYSVPHPSSILQGVKVLPPGCTLCVSGDSVVIDRWYTPQALPGPVTYGDAVDEVRSLLETSVRYRMVSDVPVGASLSGGLDSNAIVALMSRSSKEPLRTYTIAFDSSTEAKSEAGLASRAAEFYGAHHHTAFIAGDDAARALPGFFSAMDSPTGDGFNTYLIARAAREASSELKVVLSGVGGDEAFLGYRKYRWLAKRETFLRLLWQLPAHLRERLAAQIRGGSRYATAVRTVLSPETIRHLFSDAECLAITGEMPFAEAENGDPLRRLLREDIEHYLPDTLLRDLDVMTMAQSLEARAPLLDVPLLEFVSQLPLRFRRRGQSKQLLIDATSDLLPDFIRTAPKRGFELPMRRWLLEGELRPYLDLLLSKDLMSVEDGLLSRDTVLRVHHDFVREGSHYLKPWSIIAFEMWYRVQRGEGEGLQ